jgi:hypothetical protein
MKKTKSVAIYDRERKREKERERERERERETHTHMDRVNKKRVGDKCLCQTNRDMPKSSAG